MSKQQRNNEKPPWMRLRDAIRKIPKCWLESSAKFTLWALASYADENYECYPDIKTLMRDCCKSKSTILRDLKRFELEKIITVKRRQAGDRKRENIYVMDVDRIEELTAQAQRAMESYWSSRGVSLVTPHGAPHEVS